MENIKRVLSKSKARLEQRVLEEAEYIIKHGATIREAGEKFGVSHTTIKRDVERLEEISYNKYIIVSKILEDNLKDRGRRAGIVSSAKAREKRGEI